MTDADMKRVEEIDKQIGELISEKYKLVNPTLEERAEAIDHLTEDPYNDIEALAENDDYIADEVLALRENERLDKLEEDLPPGVPV